MSRPYRCANCQRMAEVSTSTGPIPSTCAACDPEGTAERESRRELQRELARKRSAEVSYLRRRVKALERLLTDQRATCQDDQVRRGVAVCGCGRDYLTVPLDGPEAACPNEVVVERIVREPVAA